MAGRITALKFQKRARNRVNIYLDGEFAFGLAAMIAAKLHVGDSLTDEEIAGLQMADEVERARDKALNLLSYRPRSEAELRRGLTKREFSDAAIEEALDRLRHGGLVDDTAFAQYWVENRLQFRPRGKWALTQELRQKGIALNIIEQALADVDEKAAAEAVAEAQARRLSHLPPELFRRRLTERLSRRGFSYELIKEILAAHTFSHVQTNSGESEDS